MTFQEELTNLINKHSLENESNTPDYILAEFLKGALDIYNTTMKKRGKWHSADIKSMVSYDLDRE